MYFLDKQEYERRFPFTRTLSENWKVVRDEYLSVAEKRIKPWHDAHIKEGDWHACVLQFSGHRDRENWERCRETARLVEGIPGLVTAGFFVLAPGTHLPPHRNYPRAVYRCHLGLVIPEKCGFKVGGETREWHEGEWLIFDPNHVHEAWNLSDRFRAILLLDVWCDPARRPLKDRLFHWLDGHRYAMAQTEAGRAFVRFMGRRKRFRWLVNLLMGGD
jgi:beta-hydroxylase